MSDSTSLVRTCRIAAKCRITRALGARLFRNDSKEIATYCRRYGLSLEDVGAGTVLFFLTTFAASSLLLFHLLGYLSFLISVLVAYGSSSWFHNWIPRQLEKERLIVSCETPLILQEIVLASAGSESIFDLAKLVVMGRHPFVSKAFSKIIERINNGDRPEKLVLKYANHQPCETLRRYLVDAVSLNLEWSEIKRLLQNRRGEAEYEYQKYTMQAETRILLIVGFGTFWPIIFSVAVFVNNLWRNLFSMVFVALLFSVLLYILERKLMKPIRNVQILGGQSSSCTLRGILNHKAKEELQETIVLISLMGEILQRENVSPEFAIKRASEIYQGWLSPLLSELTQSILYNGETFDSAWLRFAARFANPQCRQILGTLPRMIEKTAEVAGERMIEVAFYIKENQTLIEERESVLVAQRFKAKLLSVFSSAALGLVGALSPLFMLVSTRQSNLGMFPSITSTGDTIVAVVILLLMTITNTFNVTKAVGMERPVIYVFSSVSVFLVVFVSSVRLISGFT